MSPSSFWHTKLFCHIFTPVDQLLCSVLHKNGPTTYNAHFTAYNIMTLVCAGWLHEVQWDLQWVLCTAFWSMDMTGVYACLFEAVCDVTTVPSHLKWATKFPRLCLFFIQSCTLNWLPSKAWPSSKSGTAWNIYMKLGTPAHHIHHCKRCLRGLNFSQERSYRLAPSKKMG